MNTFVKIFHLEEIFSLLGGASFLLNLLESVINRRSKLVSGVQLRHTRSTHELARRCGGDSSNISGFSSDWAFLGVERPNVAYEFSWSGWNVCEKVSSWFGWAGAERVLIELAFLKCHAHDQEFEIRRILIVEPMVLSNTASDCVTRAHFSRLRTNGCPAFT